MASAARPSEKSFGVEVRIDPALFPFLRTLAPGVIGYAAEHEGELWIPLIHAIEPGRGHVGRFLDSLPNDRRVVVPNVVSDILAGMLARRGFDEIQQWTEEAGLIDVWERRPSTT